MIDIRNGTVINRSYVYVRLTTVLDKLNKLLRYTWSYVNVLMVARTGNIVNTIDVATVQLYILGFIFYRD